jgi:predicted nucleotidyltransferase
MAIRPRPATSRKRTATRAPRSHWGIPNGRWGFPNGAIDLLVMDDAAAALWGSPTFPRVLAFALDQPDREFTLQQIIHATGADRESVHRALRRAMSAGVVKRRRVGAQYLYSADRESPFHLEIKSLAAKTYGLRRLLSDVLAQPGPPMVESAFIFGSHAVGRDHAGSDVDLMVIGNATRIDLARLLRDVQESVERPINALAYTRAEVERRLRDGDAFFLEVWAAPKTMLVGGEADLPASPGEA